jgi:Tol biopolymer transport system component
MLRRNWLFLTAGGLLAQPPLDRGIGKWRFLKEASTYESGPGPKESRRQWVKDGDQVKFLHDGTSMDGKPFHTEFIAKYDGKQYPFQGGTLYNSVALFLRSADRVDQVFQLDGKVTVEATRTISPDGKRMTIDSHGALPSGKRFRNLLIYERVE